MAHRREGTHTDDLDGLRLLALGRIPRCGSCPRFDALAEVHARGIRVHGLLPDAPEHCTHQVCAPLIARFECGLEEETTKDVEILHLRAS